MAKKETAAADRNAEKVPDLVGKRIEVTLLADGQPNVLLGTVSAVRENLLFLTEVTNKAGTVQAGDQLINLSSLAFVRLEIQ